MNFERWVNLLEGALAVALVRGTIVFLLAFAATSLARKPSCQTRHLVWLGVVASFLLLPLAWLVLPALRVGGWIQIEEAAAHRIVAVAILTRQEYVRFADGAREYARLTRQSLPMRLRVLTPALLLAWLAGMLFLAGRLLAGGRKLRRLKEGAAKDYRLRRLAVELAGGMPARGKLAVLRSPQCSVPFAFGLLRPAIMLPPGAADWPLRRLRSALVHELAHIRRRDVLTQCLAYGVCLLFWFIPPLWLAYGALLREAETCCDQQVINRGFRGAEYARDLLDLARSSSGRILLPTTPGEVSRPGRLTARVRNLMSLKPGRQPFGVPDAMKVLAVCLFCLLPLLTVTCATKPSLVKHDDPVFGTWVNPAYDGERELPGKRILFPSGRELDYASLTANQPYFERRNVIQEAWIKANGDRGYKVRSQGGEVEVWAIQGTFETLLTPTPPEGQVCGIWYKQD